MVAVLLLITYRSPFLWIVPLVVVAATEQITLRAVDTIVPAFGINLQPGQVTGIASVLVFGAATNYALLLIARYREELRREEDRFAAMRAALRRTAEPILASGSTVVLGVLTLLLSEQETNRALAVACATGVIFAMLSALFVLPAVLVLFGRGPVLAVRPPRRRRRPARAGSGAGSARGGHAARCRSRCSPPCCSPAWRWAGWASAPACPRPSSSGPSPRRSPGRRPSPGPSPPAAPSRWPCSPTRRPPGRHRRRHRRPGVASARPGDAGDAVAQVDVVLDAEPGTAASDRAVEALRDAVAAVPDSAPPAVAGADGRRGARRWLRSPRPTTRDEANTGPAS